MKALICSLFIQSTSGGKETNVIDEMKEGEAFPLSASLVVYRNE